MGKLSDLSNAGEQQPASPPPAALWLCTPLALLQSPAEKRHKSLRMTLPKASASLQRAS